MDELERFVFSKRTSFEMLSIDSAFQIVTALLSHPDPFAVTLKMANSFYVGDVATIFMVIPLAVEMIKKGENLNDRDYRALGNQGMALARVIKRNRDVVSYFEQAQSMSDSEVDRLLSGFLRQNSPSQQQAYVRNTRGMYSPAVDYYLANMALHATMNDDSEAANFFQRTRYSLTKGRS